MKIDLDKYYTSESVVDFCVKTVKKLGVDFSDIIEPSAGGGAFIDKLRESFKCDLHFYDLEPDHSDVVKQDFLTLDLPYKKNRLIIGNPPFGSRNNLIVKFFKKSIGICDYIAFILPISQLNNTKQLYEFSLVESIDLGIQEYSGVNLHCCFNIYKRPENGLNKKPKQTSIEGLEVVEYRRDKLDSYRKKIGDGYFYSICSWGHSTGIKPKNVGQFSMELYFYSESEKIQKVVKEIDWQKEVSSISAKKLPKGLALEIIQRKLTIL